MKIVVDKEGRDVITRLCDVALKVGGVQNLKTVVDVLNVINAPSAEVDVPNKIKKKAKEGK